MGLVRYHDGFEAQFVELLVAGVPLAESKH